MFFVGYNYKKVSGIYIVILCFITAFKGKGTLH